MIYGLYVFYFTYPILERNCLCCIHAVSVLSFAYLLLLNLCFPYRYVFKLNPEQTFGRMAKVFLICSFELGFTHSFGFIAQCNFSLSSPRTLKLCLPSFRLHLYSISLTE